MLVALDSNNKPYVAAYSTKGTVFCCPECRDKVILKKGDIISHHFAHKPDSMCSNSGESREHMLRKMEVYDYLNGKPGISKLLPERHLGDCKPDISFLYNDVFCAIEVQRSNISHDKILERTRRLSRKKIHTLWIPIGTKESVDRVCRGFMHEDPYSSICLSDGIAYGIDLLSMRPVSNEGLRLLATPKTEFMFNSVDKQLRASFGMLRSNKREYLTSADVMDASHPHKMKMLREIYPIVSACSPSDFDRLLDCVESDFPNIDAKIPTYKNRYFTFDNMSYYFTNELNPIASMSHTKMKVFSAIQDIADEVNNPARGLFDLFDDGSSAHGVRRYDRTIGFLLIQTRKLNARHHEKIKSILVKAEMWKRWEHPGFNPEYCSVDRAVKELGW